MISRREFLKRSLFLSTGLLLSPAFVSGQTIQAAGLSQAKPAWIKLAYATPSLDPASIPQFVTELVRPPVMPRVAEIQDKDGTLVDYYVIAQRQFSQQVLPAPLPATKVWSYGPAGDLETDFSRFHYPSYTLEAAVNKPVRVRWVNGLAQTVNGQRQFLPHLLPVDPSLHWANPAGPVDRVPSFNGAPALYTGPVPMVVHVHGSHVGPESDGYPEAWFLPNAENIQGTYRQNGSAYERNRAHFASKHGSGPESMWTKNSSVFQYPNDQRAGTLWYHDHTLGMTRVNVYAGSAGFYLLRGGPDGAPLQGTLPAGDFEIPVLVQDRSFNSDGSLFFPDSREFFDQFEGPFIPDSDMHPFWNPEFFGNALVVNGHTWPKCTVKRQRYRLRLLNGCNARTLMLRITNKPPSDPSAATALPFWVIGTEGGFLPAAAVQTNRITLMPAERYDVIVDFSGAAPGSLYLVNEGPDEPFGGGEPADDFDAANPATTGVVLRFDLSAAAVSDPSTPPASLVLPAFPALGKVDFTRRVSLNELDSSELEEVGPLEALLGTVSGEGSEVEGMGMRWMDKPTEVVTLGNSEVWEIFNFTEDAHPIHLHQVMFRVLGREPIGGGPVAPPEPYELGYKDTVVTLPGWITRIQARFDVAGRYVWHCHIIDHEDNEMMRPYEVVMKKLFPMVGR